MVRRPRLSPAPSATTSRTASYDGLRGLACLIVFNFHFLYPYTRTITHGFGGSYDGVANGYPHQLPVLCLLVRGRAMVTLFFAISGFVLSYGFLGSIRSGQMTNALSRLASLTLRRWLRLFAPASISMLMVCFGSFLGAFDPGREFQDGEWLTGSWEQHPPRFQNFGRQLKDFCKMWWTWTSPFRWGFYFSEYDPHTWTIPVEFRSSIVLFVVLLASAGLKLRWSFGLVCLVTVYSLSRERWEVATFTGGAIVAHLQHAASARRERIQLLPTQKPLRPISTRVSKWALIALNVVGFVLSLFVLSFPDDQAGRTPGFRFLNRITLLTYHTAREFWHPLAAIYILWSVERLSLLRKFLSSAIPQYLGKISYGLYLVHGPLLHSAGFAMQPKIWEAIGSGTRVKWCGGLFVGWMTMLTLSIVAGHIFWLLVDEPLVRATRWLERQARR